MIYVASPYTSPNAEIRNVRFELVAAFVAHQLQRGRFCYSPIVHCHPLAIRYDLPKHAEFWKEFNLTFLRRADGLYVLCGEGWIESVGVKMEIEIAEALRLPIHYWTDRFELRDRPPA